MKPVITKIRFSEYDLNRLSKILNSREWDSRITKFKVKWADRVNAWLEVQGLDDSNKIIFINDLLFY